MTRRKMYFRMITASLVRRRSRMLVALLAIAIGATILSGLVTIYYDVPRQMGAEFRNYGANMILVAADDAFSQEDLDQALSYLGEDVLVGAAPYRYESVRINEQPILAAATDFEGAQKTSPYWMVDGAWPSENGQIMLGATIAANLQARVGDTLTVNYTPETTQKVSAGSTGQAGNAAAAGTEAGSAGQADNAAAAGTGTDAAAQTENSAAAGTDAAAADGEEEIVQDNYIDMEVVGILDTGGTEEEYVYMSLEDMETLTARPTAFDIVELSVSGTADELESYKEQITDNVGAINARLVKRVTASETTVLSKLQALVLLVTIVVLALTMICVATTMTAVVTERRKEIGLRKALGASDRSIILEFLGEGMLLGGFGGILGSLLGFAFAQGVSVNVFNSSIRFRFLLVPITILVSVTVTGLACMLPIRSATEVDPALVLKGE